MSARRGKAPAVPAMHPREKLTRKARRAISEYALARCRGLTIFEFAVRYTLEAERMPRGRLYEWLYAHGYQWYPGSGIWKKEEGKVQS